jgi:hypothetical protein
MNGSSAHNGLSNWLAQATQNLPQQPASIIRAELADHFEDAVADLLEQGISEAAAHQRALVELGDPQLAAYGFKDVYLGRHHYMAAMVISLIMMMLPFLVPQIHAALGIIDLSMADRIFYIIAHIVSTSLLVYVVVTFRKLLVWRFNNQTVEMPIKIVLGSATAYLIGNAISELTVESWDPTPTFLSASNALEGAGLLIMHGSMLALGISFLLLLACCLSIRNTVLKVVVVLGGLFNVFYILTLVLYYLNMPQAFLFYNLRVLTSLALWPTVSLLFLHPLFFYRRPPLQTV